MSLLSRFRSNLSVLNSPLLASTAAFTYIDDTDDLLNKFLSADSRGQLSKVDGYSIAIKDNICHFSEVGVGAPTTAGSRILEHYHSPFTATSVQRLINAGAIIVGHTNCDEFGMGSFGLNSSFKPTTQFNSDLIAGGSSSGSAVAVQSGACAAALGSDTGGSVRLPAAFCGIVGFKPSWGYISRYGLIAYAGSLDTIGILARDVSTARQVFEVVADEDDPNDATNNFTFDGYVKSSETKEKIDPENWKYIDRSVPRKRKILVPSTNDTNFMQNLRVGYLNDFLFEELMSESGELTLKSLNASLEAIHSLTGRTAIGVDLFESHGELDHIENLISVLAAYYCIATAEAASNLSRYDGMVFGDVLTKEEKLNCSSYLEQISLNRTKGFGAEVQRRILMGNFVLSRSMSKNKRCYDRANAIRAELTHRLHFLLDRSRNPNAVDFIIAPVTPIKTPTLKEALEIQNNPASGSEIDEYLTDVFNVCFSLAGLPAISIPVPVGHDNGRAETGSIQIVGGFGKDDLLLRVAEHFERQISKQIS